MDLLVVGNISVDTIQIGKAPPKETIGGGALNFALAASLVGCPTRVLSVVGQDFPFSCLPRLPNLELDYIRVESMPTTRFLLRYDELYQLQEVISSFSPVVPRADLLIPEQVSVKFAHISCRDPIRPEEFLRNITARSVSVDVMWTSLAKRMSSLLKVLARIDFLFLNAKEYSLIHRRMPDLMNRHELTSIVTRAEAGLDAFQGGHRLLSVPAYPVKARDPTGAGDILAGGCVGMLCQGAYLADALVHGAALASMSVEDLGCLHLVQRVPGNIGDRLKWIRDRISIYVES